MVQQQRLIQLPLAGALILGFLAALYLFVWKWFAKPEHEPGVSNHSTGKSAEEVRKYWTAEKARKAQPAPMPHIDGKTDKGKSGSSRPPKA
jgi:hypothetical protein